MLAMAEHAMMLTVRMVVAAAVCEGLYYRKGALYAMNFKNCCAVCSTTWHSLFDFM